MINKNKEVLTFNSSRHIQCIEITMFERQKEGCITVICPFQTYSFGENSNYNLRDEDQLYTMIFLVLVPLRIFGTIRFFIAVHKSISNDNLVIFNHIDHVLLYFQSVGDSGQAFCNAILFCLKDRVVRRGLLERLRRFCGRPTYGESERLLSNNYVS